MKLKMKLLDEGLIGNVVYDVWDLHAYIFLNKWLNR